MAQVAQVVQVLAVQRVTVRLAVQTFVATISICRVARYEVQGHALDVQARTALGAVAAQRAAARRMTATLLLALAVVINTS